MGDSNLEILDKYQGNPAPTNSVNFAGIAPACRGAVGGPTPKKSAPKRSNDVEEDVEEDVEAGPVPKMPRTTSIPGEASPYF
jgi:hypothetical protein